MRSTICHPTNGINQDEICKTIKHKVKNLIAIEIPQWKYTNASSIFLWMILERKQMHMESYLLLSSGKIHGQMQVERMRKMYPNEMDLINDKNHVKD